jgi:ApaG protein
VLNSSEATTRGVVVKVESSFISERSDPMRNRWFFSYRIRIANLGDEVVQLISRHWIITDAHGNIEEVKGPGVVGQQPVLEPGEEYEYTSFCPLATPFGTMHGSYQMTTENGETFDAEIAQFALSEPMTVN